MAARRNVGATRWLPNDHPKKFLFNSPRNAWITLCATWEHSPTPHRIVEDIEDFFDSVVLIIESEGGFVDKNLRHGRRQDQMCKQEEPTVEAMDKMPKRKRNTKASSTFDEVVDMHPNATWALDKEMDMMVEDGVKADGSDMAALEDYEPVDRTKESAEDMTTGEDDLILPEDWGKMHSVKYFKVHDDNIRMAKEEKRKQKELERTALKEAKAAARKSKAEEKAATRKGVKRPRAKAAKKTKKPKSKYYPEEGAPLEYYIPPGEDDEGGWVAATFGSWEIDAENDEVATLKYANGETSTLVLREMRWAKMFPCKKCNLNTRGRLCCLTCRRLRNGEEDDDYSGSDSGSD